MAKYKHHVLECCMKYVVKQIFVIGTYEIVQNFISAFNEEERIMIIETFGGEVFVTRNASTVNDRKNIWGCDKVLCADPENLKIYKDESILQIAQHYGPYKACVRENNTFTYNGFTGYIVDIIAY